MGTANGVLQDLSTTPNVCQQPQGRSNISSKRRMNSYEQDSLRMSGMRSPSMNAQKASAIP